MGLGEYKTIQSSATELAALLKELSARLEKLEMRMAALEQNRPVQSVPAADVHGVSVSGSGTPTSFSSTEREMLLAPADEQIISLIRSRGHVCATDVQLKFKYRGKNAACARLNRLYELGLLEKTQA